MLKDEVPKRDSEENTARVREMVALIKKDVGVMTGGQTSCCKCKRGGNFDCKVLWAHFNQTAMKQRGARVSGTTTVVLLSYSKRIGKDQVQLYI